MAMSYNENDDVLTAYVMIHNHFLSAIFLKPKSPAFIMSVNDRMSEEQAEKSFNRAVRLEQDFLQYFTSIVDGEKFEDIYEKVKSVIKSHSKTRIWVSANEMF